MPSPSSPQWSYCLNSGLRDGVLRKNRLIHIWHSKSKASFQRYTLFQVFLWWRFFIRWFPFLPTCLVTLLACFLHFLRYIIVDSYFIWHKKTVANSRSGEVHWCVDWSENSAWQNCLPCHFPDSVVWKQRKCYANYLLIPLHYLFHFSFSFSHSISSTARWQADTLKLLIRAIEERQWSITFWIYVLQLMNLTWLIYLKNAAESTSLCKHST